MRKVMNQVHSLFQTIKEELIALDKKTDFTSTILNHMLLNEDFEDDIYCDDEDDLENCHFGLVRFTSCVIALFSLWFLISTTIIIL